MLAVKLNYYLRRVFRGHRDILSGDGKVLCDACSTVGGPAFFLDGQFDKVVGVTRSSTLQRELTLIQAGVRHHRETRLFDIGSAVLLDGTIYKGGRKRKFRKIDPVQRETVQLDAACLISSFVGVKYFGHWLADDCLSYELGKQYAPPLCVRTPPWSDKQFYADVFQQDWTPTDRARIGRLFVLSDFAQNDLKMQRYSKFRKLLRRSLPSPGEDDIVYLKRGSSGANRSMGNEDAIIDLLASQGIAICEVEKDPISVTLQRLLGAKLVISVEGSQLAHTIYSLRQGAGVLVIQPPYHFNACHKAWMDRLGMSFGFVVGDSTTTGYDLNPEELMATIDLMLKHVR